jgi:hypothetical protein
MPLPPNTLAELQCDMARLGFVVSQIREIEEARQKRLEQQPETGPHAMVRLLAPTRKIRGGLLHASQVDHFRCDVGYGRCIRMPRENTAL